MTLTCADLHRNELISITPKIKGENLQEKHTNSMDFFERCTYLNIDLVLLAPHFQYRAELSFKVIVINGPLSNVKYQFIDGEEHLYQIHMRTQNVLIQLQLIKNILILNHAENIKMINVDIIFENFLQKGLQPLLNHLPDPVRNNILIERERVLLIVKNYIDTHLDPRKRNKVHSHKENFEHLLVYKIFRRN